VVIKPLIKTDLSVKNTRKGISSQLCSFLERNSICKDFQSEFRLNHSTETALIRVTKDLLLSSDRDCISLLVLLDLSAAFDTIDHYILLNRLKNMLALVELHWYSSIIYPLSICSSKWRDVLSFQLEFIMEYRKAQY